MADTKQERADERKKILDELNDSGQLFSSIDSTEKAANLEPIWGNWLFKNVIVEEVGEPGISKTTFNYAFASSLLNSQPFLGVNGTHPLQSYILYIDLESDDTLIKARRHLLDIPDNPYFLKCNQPNVTLRELEPYIDELIKGKPVSIMFIDPLRSAFSTHDENDNAEASQQMKYLRYLTQKWQCAIVLVHHSSKAEMGGTRKGSGAYARVALADIIWNFERLGEEFSSDLFKFYIPKSRQIQDDLQLCIKREGGSFEEVDFPIGYTTRETGIRIYSMQQAIDVIMQDRHERTPAEMLEQVNIATSKDYNRSSLWKALTALIQLGVISKTKYGKYIFSADKKPEEKDENDGEASTKVDSHA